MDCPFGIVYLLTFQMMYEKSVIVLEILQLIKHYNTIYTRLKYRIMYRIYIVLKIQKSRKFLNFKQFSTRIILAFFQFQKYSF